MLRPDPLDVRFEGFGAEAFDLLEQLRRRPRIEEYRKEKESIRSYIQEPFKRYRDDLVVNWVLPNRIGLETEKNVFSRFLKNDFGAGGCHHHYWMSFYRPGRRRLQDVQLAHSLWPDAFHIVVYLGNPAPRMFRRVHSRILSRPDELLKLVNPLLRHQHTTLFINHGNAAGSQVYEDPLKHLPTGFENARELAVRSSMSSKEVIELGPRLLDVALDSIVALWPAYQYFMRFSAADG